MKRFILFILLMLTLNHCEFLNPEVTFYQPAIPANITDFELLPPIQFGNDSYRIGGARFRVDGEAGMIFNVRYKVFGRVWFCSNGKKEVFDIASDMILIADTLRTSFEHVQIGVGIEYLTVPIDIDGLQPDQHQYAGTVGVSIYYRNDEGNRQVSKSESYDKYNMYCQ